MGTIPQTDRLSAVLFSKTRREILGLVYSHPDEAFYLRQLVRACGGGVGAVQRELRELSKVGILRRTSRGNQVYFQANPQCPIYAELRGLIIKTAGVGDVLRTALAPLADRIRFAFVHGSLAEGREDRQSDVDLVVVGEATFSEIIEAVGPVQDVVCREINPVVYPSEEFHSKIAAGHHFLTSVIKKRKLLLIGDQDELEGLAPQ